MFDEHFYYNPVIPPYGLADAFGYREKESMMMNSAPSPRDVAPSDRIYYEPEIEFTEPLQVRVKAHTFLTPVALTSASPIATCQGLTVAAMKRVGKGTVYYMGTNLGASITAGNPGGIELLRAIITRVVRPDVTSDKLRPRLIQGSKRSLLAVFNDGTEDQTHIGLPPQYHRAKNIHSQAEAPLDHNGIRVTVPYQDAAVYLLEP
jgi:hypothetical protein